MFECRYRWFNVCCSCMIQSDHVAISTAQELISDGWLVSKRDDLLLESWRYSPPLCGMLSYYFLSQLIPHVSIFMLDSTSFSLEYPMCRCQMVHFGYEKKNYTWSELLPDRPGRVFHNREQKISQCLRPMSQSACSIWISAYSSLPGLNYFLPLISLWLFGAWGITTAFMIPSNFQTHPCA